MDDHSLSIHSSFLDSLPEGSNDFSLRAGEFGILLSINVTVDRTPLLTLVSDDWHTVGEASDLVATLDLIGLTDFSVSINQTVLDSADYTFLAGELRILAMVLDLLPARLDNVLKVSSTGGDAELTFIINDVPVLLDKTDFIKLPGETVVEEDYRFRVDHEIGTLTYEYALLEGNGVFTDHENGRFSFVPNAIFAGTVTFVMTVTDSYGASAEKTYSLVYKTVNPVIYDAIGQKIVDKNDTFGDVVMTVDTYGTESSSLYFDMLDVLRLDESIGSTNVVFPTNGNMRLFSIKAAYLRSLSVGIHTFTLVTEAGQATFTIEVVDTRAIAVSVAEVTFRKTVTEGDVTVTITPYNNLINADSFVIDGVIFTETTDFTYADHQLMILSAFLNRLTQGTYVIAINGVDLITLTIQDPTAPVIDPSQKTISLLKAAIVADLSIECLLFGLEAESILYVGEVVVDASNYEIITDGIVLDTAYLATLTYGTHPFRVENSNGTDSFVLRLSDGQTAGLNQNVTKFTYETISAEALRVSAIAPWEIGSVYLTDVTYYSLTEVILATGVTGGLALSNMRATGDFGTIDLNSETLSFGFTRQAGWYGIVVITYIAVDETGAESAPIQMDILYKQVAPVIDSKDAKTYVAGSGMTVNLDIVYTITNASGNSDFPVYALWHEDLLLTLDTEYSIGGKVNDWRFFTLKATYLSTLSVGTHTFTIFTNGGQESFVVTILSSLSTLDATESFDKALPADVTFSLIGNPRSVSSVMNGSVVVAIANYTFENGVLTIASAYLSTQPYGDCELIVSNGIGSVTLTISITDTRESVLLSTTIEYTIGSNISVDIDFELYANAFEGLLYDALAVDSLNYTFSAGQLVLLGTYLESIASGHETLTFTFLSTPDIEIIVDVIVILNLPSATIEGDGFEIDTFNDVEFVIDLNGNTFLGVAVIGTALTNLTDYEFNSLTNRLTIYGELLIARYEFGTVELALTLLTVEDHNVGFAVPYANAEARLLNGGFETGSIYGWNSYSIWKAETGMIAWQDARVINNTYFGSNPYARDGAFNLGIVWSGAAWDQSSERMGHLRSAPFVLGGSGWISFKLGGGRNASFAYLSVRRTSDNVEVARFGNPHFNDTALATSQYGSTISNAEAFMFQYYFDLSTVASLGTSLYITLTDAASFDWSILSADSFFTYHAIAPTTNANTLAVNIVPSILNTATATNAIKNGSFENNLDDWQNVNDAWSRDSGGYVRSNPSGDGNTGVLRSSAFTTLGNPYLRLDWAGGLKWEKQIFISVKEVGTNIEVLRFVVRGNLASKEGTNFDNHMLDLSGLDTSKQYYLELSDNRTGSWGVSILDSIRFVPLTEWNSVTADDRAVSISGLVTAFTYQLPY